MIKPKPFVKWVGGKRQLIHEIKKRVPKEFNIYYEPFIGGGALFFELQPKIAVINDYNDELINIYRVLSLKDKTNKLIQKLKNHEEKNNKEYFYEVRSWDRNREEYNKLNDIEKATRTIYLNKTCFNGIYRVNSKNEFNVPFNNSKNINTFDNSNFKAINDYFNNNITIINGDFEEAVKGAKKGDFVYFDPPYDNLKDDTFTSYTENGFDKKGQVRLFNCFEKLDKMGVYVMLSNHNTSFINDLYKNYNIKVVNAKRSINSNGNKRGNVEETIITNY